MRKPRYLMALILLCVIALTVSALAQDMPDLRGTSFELVYEIGRALPQKLIYDPNFERYAAVDAYGQLLLIDAETYDTEHILHSEGQFNDLLFSHDGHWLAVANGTTIELWNAETGELAAEMIGEDLSQARRIHGPMTFSPDDNLLLFFGTYPESQALRRTENDTQTVPWLWHLPAARDEGASSFPRGLEAVVFYDYRNGFVLGPENRVVAALPGRLHVLDGNTGAVLYEIDTARYEQDPLTVWFSLRDNRIYVRPVNVNSFIQVDTARGVLVEVPLRTDLTLNDLETLGGLELGSQAQVIGDARSRSANPLLQALLGDDYRRPERYGQQRLTVTLIDLLTPPINDTAAVNALLFVYNEDTQIGQLILAAPWQVQQMTLSPDGQTLLMRRSGDRDENIEAYDIASGDREFAFIPSLRGTSSYRRAQRNRVLAYTNDGSQFLSDFQRYDAESSDVVAEDLRYSRRFDRFYFSEDSTRVVTMSGTEWRIWNLTTGEVERREVVNLRGEILRTSQDGYRFLTRFYDSQRGEEGVEILDMNTGERRSIVFRPLIARYIDQVVPSPDWEHFLITYSDNEYGPYYPGNEVALYSMENGPMQFLAGDDLPYADERAYGWLDNRTAYVSGVQYSPEDSQPGRVYGVEYHPSGIPVCLAEQFPDEIPTYNALWNEVLAGLNSYETDLLAVRLCEGLARGQLDPRTTLEREIFGSPDTPTPIVLPGAPACLTSRYPDQAEAYAQSWRTLTAGISAADRAELDAILCEGLGTGNAIFSSTASLTMLIDVKTGERSVGSYTPPANTRPIQPILDEFLRTERRNLGTAILSPDQQLIAASNLPGELVVFRLKTTYQTLLGWETATANADFATQQMIVAAPSSTPTPGLIGTIRPTLTPTITPTAPPLSRTQAPLTARDETVQLCPAEHLYTIENPPEGYSPTGRLLGPVQGDTLWAIEPENGRRNPDENVPPCGFGLRCTLSPDRRTILARSDTMIYVVNPDGTNSRVLFDNDPPEEVYQWPREIYWSGTNTLEWEVYEQVAGQRQGYRDYQYRRDILGVFPDPDLWWPYVWINGREAYLVQRQPGGPLAVVYTTFSTGYSPGYEYYLYNTETGEAEYFARMADYPARELRVAWHPLGDRLFYTFSEFDNDWYLYTPATGEHQWFGRRYGGVWSNDGRYRVFATDSRAQPIGIWDSHTGLLRTYCLPETGARLYEGNFYWSPDSRYVALQTTLPADEGNDAIGQRVLVLDVETGSVTSVSYGGGTLFMWAEDPGVGS